MNKTLLHENLGSNPRRLMATSLTEKRMHLLFIFQKGCFNMREEKSSPMDIAKRIKYKLHEQREMAAFSTQQILKQRIIDADKNVSKVRSLAQSIASFAHMMPIREWVVGMTTEPGDIVWDPDDVYRYVYTGSESMEHTDPDSYPGSDAAYWAIIPRIFGNLKIFPDAENAVISVRQGELWFNADTNMIYMWVGPDTDNCTEPPSENSNVWTKHTEFLE